MTTINLNHSCQGYGIPILCVAVMAIASGGCGRSAPAHWPIAGKVTFQGEPVTAGQIRFSNPTMGVDVVALLNAEGRYVIVDGKENGLPEGKYQIAVTPKLDFSRVRTDSSGFPVRSTMPSTAERNPPNIPRKYHEPSTSGVTVTVEPRSNNFDIDMQPDT